MKHDLRIMFAIIFILVVLIVSVKAGADEQIVTIRILPTPTPIPQKMPVREPDQIPYYSVKEKEVDILARLLWSSPLRSRAAKETLLWVVLNRVDDISGAFGNTIETVVIKSEFTFYDRKAHLSDKNKEIATDIMQKWKAEKDGYYIGRRVPRDALYIRFEGENNRDISVTSVPGAVALEW